MLEIATAEAARTRPRDGIRSEVGQTPSSAADALVGLLFALLRRRPPPPRDAGPGGPARTRASAQWHSLLKLTPRKAVGSDLEHCTK